MVAQCPEAKKAGTSSIFHTDTPFGPYRAIGPPWQNSREKPHVLAFWPTLWPKGSTEVAPKPRRNLIALASFAPARMRSGGLSGPRDPIFRSCPLRPPLAEAFLDFPGFHCIVASFVGTPFAIIADRCTSLHFIAFRFISLHRCNRCMQRLQRCNEKRCAQVSRPRTTRRCNELRHPKNRVRKTCKAEPR